jgi:hypothetical protein
MRTWTARISAILLAAGLAVLADSCMPFNPLTAAGMEGVKIYWSAGDVIRRANLDGSDQELVYTDSPGSQIGTLIVDNVGGKIYYSESMTSMRTYSVNLDGTGKTTIATFPSTCLAINSAEGKLYIGTDVGQIYECGLDGTGLKNILTGAGMVADLDYDSINQRLYWISGGDIWRSPVGGTLSGTPIATAASASTMALDALGGKIYWGTTGANYIRTAGLNGGPGTSLPGYMAAVYGLSVDPFEGQLYWTAGASRENFYHMSVDGGAYPIVFRVSGTGGMYLDLWP